MSSLNFILLVMGRMLGGRVGEKATPSSATRSPLVEPELQISRVRLS